MTCYRPRCGRLPNQTKPDENYYNKQAKSHSRLCFEFGDDSTSVSRPSLKLSPLHARRACSQPSRRKVKYGGNDLFTIHNMSRPPICLEKKEPHLSTSPTADTRAPGTAHRKGPWSVHTSYATAALQTSGKRKGGTGTPRKRRYG